MPATPAFDIANAHHPCGHPDHECHQHTGHDDSHTQHEDGPAPDVNLPSELLVPVAIGARDTPRAEGDPIDALKAIGPEGVPVAVAFTTQAALAHFAKLVGLKQGSYTAIPVSSEDLLAQLAEASETELCVDPASPTERMLRYSEPNVVTRATQPHGDDFHIGPPAAGLPEDHRESLRATAASLPFIEEVWLLEVTSGGSRMGPPSSRPLVVVRQSIPRHHEQFDNAFMELGNRWCETLPRGIAVDMLPHDAPPLDGRLDDECRLYKRATS